MKLSRGNWCLVSGALAIMPLVFAAHSIAFQGAQDAENVNDARLHERIAMSFPPAHALRCPPGLQIGDVAEIEKISAAIMNKSRTVVYAGTPFARSILPNAFIKGPTNWFVSDALQKGRFIRLSNCKIRSLY